MTGTEFVTQIFIVVLCGLLSGVVAAKLKIPNPILLMISGALLSTVFINTERVFYFSYQSLANISTLCLIMVTFIASTKLKFRETDTYSDHAWKILAIFFVLSSLFLVATEIAMTTGNIILAAIFSLLVIGVGTREDVFQPHDKRNRVYEIMKRETAFNSPFIIIASIIFISLLQLKLNLAGTFLGQLMPLALYLLTGAACGIAIGLLMLRIFRKLPQGKASTLILLAFALLDYAIADSLGGSGIISVAITGFMIGNFIRLGRRLDEPSTAMIAKVAEIIVFLFIGAYIPTALSLGFLMRSMAVFAVIMALRFAAVVLSFYREKYSAKEKAILILNYYPGLASAAVVFFLFNLQLADGTRFIMLDGARPFLDLWLMVLWQSAILAIAFKAIVKKEIVN
ncbi:MAG: hypothetical protein HGA85_04455 [Nanoarchaeota archaeon]|nr:hypothetical protein [Nanoarchaeota archaeon]